MRVLGVGNMYPPHHLGGYELMWLSAVRELRRRDHEVRILTTDLRLPSPDGGIPEDPDAHRELRWYWRDHEFPRLGLRQRLALERHNARVLDRHLREFRPEVVSWWAMGGMSLSLIEQVRRRGLPAAGMVHDDWMVYGPRVDAWLRLADRLGALARALGLATGVPARVDLGAAARWLFVSEATRRRALAAGAALPETAVVHSGIELSRFRPAAEREWRWRLLYVGRLDPRKGISVAVRALAELPAQATLEVVGAGDPAYAAELHRLAAELGLGGRLRLGRRERDEIPAAYAAADAVLFPVLWEEPWGLVPLEAMASGRPVVASGAGGSAEYLREGENCLLYAPREDPAALAGAVRRLAAEPELRARLRAGGLTTAPRYTADGFAGAVVETLERRARGG